MDMEQVTATTMVPPVDGVIFLPTSQTAVVRVDLAHVLAVATQVY